MQIKPPLGHPGYTLVEVMIVVCLLAVLLAIVLPNFIKSRGEAQAKACIANLTQIETAKAQWSFDYKISTDIAPTQRQLVGYLRNLQMPTCPAGGNYTIRKLSVHATCSEGKSGHVLP